jgi:sec-independent protein translocase protein TatA
MVRGLVDNPIHLLLVLLVFVLLFGGKRLPDAARGLGRSLRIFKAEVKEMQDDGKHSSTEPESPRVEPEPLEGRIVDPARNDAEQQRASAERRREP